MAMCTSRGVTTGEGLQVSMQIPSFQNQGGSRGQSPSPQGSQDLRVSSREMQHPLMSALTTPAMSTSYGSTADRLRLVQENWTSISGIPKIMVYHGILYIQMSVLIQ